ncbi:predicted protein [Sclerotinia sclerotiorum 1980 UF-70]|uniref:Uncharacterized protein n=1 Tax=Sclerotinia sclerotiorum (strain ATCC 18683 / 1980 / Ss-1) TaxID=665079 RepID=A7EJ02_SCLS1|nr:predicted protein [Sclerotinia sclerotiorum 1980 UF-70]EDO02818.1 predicted protein [Sclerotinia sclerotiorum 1980 UF-70]
MVARGSALNIGMPLISSSFRNRDSEVPLPFGKGGDNTTATNNRPLHISILKHTFFQWGIDLASNLKVMQYRLQHIVVEIPNTTYTMLENAI